MEHGAYGELLAGSFDGVPGGMPYQWVGGLGVRADALTGLHYMRHRWYDQASNRWLSRDPLGIRAELNLYAYPQNPTTVIDPFGLKGSIQHGAACEVEGMVEGLLLVGSLWLIAGSGGTAAPAAAWGLRALGVLGAMNVGNNFIQSTGSDVMGNRLAPDQQQEALGRFLVDIATLGAGAAVARAKGGGSPANPSVDAILDNPMDYLMNRDPQLTIDALRRAGWQEGQMTQGKGAGTGYIFRQLSAKNQPTGKCMELNPNGNNHFGKIGYWKITGFPDPFTNKPTVIRIPLQKWNGGTPFIVDLPAKPNPGPSPGVNTP